MNSEIYCTIICGHHIKPLCQSVGIAPSSCPLSGEEGVRSPEPLSLDGKQMEQKVSSHLFLLFFAYSSLSCLPECVISVWLCERPRYCNLMRCLRTSPESVGHHLKKHKKAIQTGLIILNSFSMFNIFDANHLIPNRTVTRRVANIKDDEAGV